MGAVTHPTAAARARSASEGGRTGPTCKAEGVRPSQGALGRAARQPESALHTPVRKLARDILSKKKRNAGQCVCYDALVCFTGKPNCVPGAFPMCVEEHT